MSGNLVTLDEQTHATANARPARGRSPRLLAEAVEAHPACAFAVLTALYAVVVCVLSSLKLLWLDELITLHIARLNSARAIWHALAAGADPNPPLIHIAVMLCRRMFGEHELALRLPALAGYWVGMLSLFLFLKRRLPAVWALAGTVMSMCTAGFDYSFESRSYAIVHGLAMLAILCWSRATDVSAAPFRRRAGLCGMVLALGLGVCAHYFAVLAFLPIAGGEVARFVVGGSRRRGQSATAARPAFFSGVWAGLALAAAPMLAFRALIERSIVRYAPHAWNKVSFQQAFNSYTEMVEIILYPLAALFCFSLLVRLLATVRHGRHEEVKPHWLSSLVAQQSVARALFPVHEMVATVLLMAYPFLGYMIAKAHGGMFSPRFVIPVCLGFGILGTAVGFRLFGHLRLAGPVLLLFCLAWFVSREAFVGYTYSEQKRSFYNVVRTFPDAYPSGAVAVPDPLMALTLQHYAPRPLTSRIVFPLDFPAVRLFRGDDSPEENLYAGRDTIYHLPLVALSDLQQHTSDYLVLAADGNWLTGVLREHGYPVDKLPIDTQANDIGGFTPLAHGVPAYFLAAGDHSPRTALPLMPAPQAFDPAAARPDAR